MSNRIRFGMIFGLGLLWFVPAIASAADEDLKQKATWSQPTLEQAKARVDQWLAAEKLDEVAKAKVETLWTAAAGQPEGVDLLERVAATATVVNPNVQPLVTLCHGTEPMFAAPKFAFLADEKTPAWIRSHLKLLLARSLTQRNLMDEALEQMADLKVEDVVDPTSLLFYQAVCHHRLLDKEKCLPALAKLMENKGSLPRRFETVAALMEADLAPLKPDSLDEVARLMDDVERRLGLHRAGKVVRKEEDDVIAKLDKMIEEMEKAAAAAAAAAAGSSGGSQPNAPMQDSMPGGGSGPGDVEQKRIGARAGWGNLPPKERQEALQQISKGLPSHYRDVIEEYFRKLARDGND